MPDKEKEKWIVTSAWPYSSDVPHLGNLIGSVLSADVHARYLRLRGHSVIFVSGSDEHGTPVEIEAMRQGIPVKEFADRNHERIARLFQLWNISYDNYTRTSSQTHMRFVQEHYKRLYERGLIYSKEERVHYCPRDDKFLPDRFVEGTCPHCSSRGARGDQCDSCGKPIEAEYLLEPYCAICKGPTELRSTKQWFFDLPKLSEQIRQYILSNPHLSENAVRFSLSLIEEGLKPRSITRDTKWGIPAPFPGAEGKTIYVWMEAVLGYISAVMEYFEKRGEPEKWREYWLDPNTKSSYFIGKDNIPFHTIILPGLLIGSGEPYALPKIVSSTEFLQFEGKKFSKSRKVGIWIDEALKLLPRDYWRYALLSVRPEAGDVNFTYELLEEKVNGELNDTIGNFANRSLSAIKRYLKGVIKERPRLGEGEEGYLEGLAKRHEELAEAYEALRIQRAVKIVLEQAQEGNRYLNAVEPWRIINSDRGRAEACLYVAARTLKALSVELFPIIPDTALRLRGFLSLSQEPNWDEALEDFQYPLVIGNFEPLFRKITKEEVIKKLEELRRISSAQMEG